MLEKVNTINFPLTLLKLLKLSTWHSQKALKLYNKNNAALFTTSEKNGLIGIHISKSFCEILHLSVLPSFQKKGIGSHMIRQVIDVNPQLEFIFAETDMDAVEFYRKFGFQIIKLPTKFPNTIRFLCIYSII
ncbi:GNAT family N-acetyltransferase [Listeria sp. FSL L7-1517]|uniref:GNAT family N-acetyltransferase n=1 Tax=Listeria immobilis TaxID=2713502 RepID=UPI00164DCD19|nr:GNAT family N-acetyltransferase [Listeria immobilis]MBC6297876.1 GNAT family N-acetyltransferase [Listeria immobilis]